MDKIKLLKEPGYIYDLMFVFCLKFNTQLYIDALPKDNNKEDNESHFRRILNRFDGIPSDLYVFFHAIETGRAFLPMFYFNPYKNQFATEYNFKYLFEELSDRDQLIRNLIKFYFHEFDNETVEQCCASLNKICSHIKKSNYSDEEKTKLYEFFLDPESHIQILQYELISKNFMLSEYYKENYQKIIDVYNQTTYEILCNQMDKIQDFSFLIRPKQVLYTSYCLLNKFCINFYLLGEGCLSLLGYDYISILDFVKETGREPDLCSLGTALCEESRIKILNFLLERGEVTCKDLEKEFSFSGSTAYHHISIMTKTGLLKTRNEGKTILYSINANYISDIVGIFNNFLKRRGK